MEEIKLEQLERTSRSWNRKTKNILLHLEGGAANMFGGSFELLHVILHGDNSITETGTIEVKGYVAAGYSIARGANGPSRESVSYYRGAEKREDVGADTEPAYQITIEGTSGGGVEALCSILSAEKDWLIKT